MNKVTAKNRALTALLTLVSCALTALIAEGALRLAGHKPVPENAWYLATPTQVPDRYCITIRPELLRKDTYRCLPGAEQVVALGDSFTEGAFVDRSLSYPSALAGILRDAGKSAVVINAGVGDTGPDQQLSLFKNRVLARTVPDIVIWQFYPNDVWDNVNYPVYTVSREGALIPRSGMLHWRFINKVISASIPLPDPVKEKSYLLNSVIKTVENLTATRVPAEYRADPRLWSRRKLELEAAEMNKLSQAYGFKVYFVLIAPQAWYLPGAGNGRSAEAAMTLSSYESLRGLLKGQEHYIEVEFTRRDLTALRERFPGRDFSGPLGSELFSPAALDHNPAGDRHFNKYGYWLMARKIGDHLGKNSGRPASRIPPAST